MITRDSFETQVYYAKRIGRFLRIDRLAKPTLGDLVAVEQLAADKIRVQRYRGQAYIGVVRVLELYKMSSWEPRTIQV